MNIAKKRVYFGLIFLSAACLAHFAHACKPSPVLLYPADKVYKSKGMEIPELPDNAIALINGEYVSKKVYKEWLYKKLGFECGKRKTFVITRSIEKGLQQKGIDTARLRKIILDNFLYFNKKDLCKSCEDWDLTNKQREKENRVKSKDDKFGTSIRFEYEYLMALYVMENWDALYDDKLKEFVGSDIFKIEGDDEAAKEIIRLHNAHWMFKRFRTLILPKIEHAVLSGTDLNLPGSKEEYKDWLYRYYNTEFLVENYVVMQLSDLNAKKHQLQLSKTTVQELFSSRVEEYKTLLKRFKKTVPEDCISLEFSPVYEDYIMQEVHDDLYKSKAFRDNVPLKPHQIQLRFYEKYGFNGQRNEVLDIYKWIRRRKSGRVRPGSEAYKAAEQARETHLRDKVTEIRSKILAEGPESFLKYAMIENDVFGQQKNAGLININKKFDPKLKEKLKDLPLREVSPVMEGPDSAFSLFWLAEMDGTNGTYHCISKDAPISEFYSVSTHQNAIDEMLKEVQGIQERVRNGESFKELAEKHSDSFRRNQGDISATYQSQFGYAFANELSSIPVGGLKIIDSNNGIHLVKIVSRTETPFTDTIKEEIIQQYRDEIATQDERYIIATKLLFESNPYFK